jgi:hypothetical protein
VEQNLARGAVHEIFGSSYVAFTDAVLCGGGFLVFEARIVKEF